jgi:diacylglycerol O-acyltransferase / wax synthase
MSGRAGTQLRGWDAATWRTGNGDANLRSTVVALAILDRPPDWDRLLTRLERLTHFVPQLRMRPYFGALGVSAPRLAFDPDFDIHVHAHRYRLPEGSGWSDLLAEARRMSLTDFDASRPLWEAVVIEGLPNDEAAFLLKLHHSIADGQATVMIALALFELGEQPNPDDPPTPDLPPAEDVGLVDVFVANAGDNIRRGFDVAGMSARTLVNFAKGTVTDPVDTWTRAAQTLASIGRFTSMPDGPLSPVMNGRGTTYRFAAFALEFSDLRSVAKEHDASVNDAFMAAVGAGMDIYHRRHGEVIEEIRVNVPISLRGDPGDRSGQVSNAVSIARFPLPIAGLTPSERMQAAHVLVDRWRHEPALRLADPLAEVSWFVPVPMLAHAAQASDVTTSNVPGPPIPLYLAGARMIAAYPLVATIGAAVNITMVTYDGQAFIGISADERAVPDLGVLVDDLRSGFAEVTGNEPGLADRYAAPTPQ